ncbi:NUDIX domain-containing protein [Roseovarius sp. M141]|uniref:NUDIX domain-containing protein n=1 Tax=Roseovarius sp. M141 TaxID=2583806 RepID=UPI0020CED4E4|nr:NUDIX hydrolase [Roseovarius sp. M141]MCQ0091485.1 NUDIX hydrolase [Roseovarius sp. M141]
MIRRVGNLPRPDISYRMRHGVYAILPRQGGLLVTLQEEPKPELQLPGGGIDPGESPLRALHREVMEETGWIIAAPRRIGAFRRFVYMPEYDMWAEKLCTIYVARPVRAICAPTEAGHRPLTISTPDATEQLGNEGDRMFVSHWAGLA